MPVVSFLRMQGADAATSFSDENGNAVTANGGAQTDTAWAYLGTSSCLLSGSGASLSIANNSSFDAGAGDFCIEIVAKRSGDGSGDRFLVSQGNGSAFLIRWNASGNLQAFIGGALKVDYAFAFTSGVEYTVTLFRLSGVAYLLVNGAIVGSASSTENISSSADIMIGGYLTTDYFAGWIGAFRLTVGESVYSGAYTPSPSLFGEPVIVAEGFDLSAQSDLDIESLWFNCAGFAMSAISIPEFEKAGFYFRRFRINAKTGFFVDRTVINCGKLELVAPATVKASGSSHV